MGQKVESMVDTFKGKKVLRQVALSGRLNKRRRNNRRGNRHYAPMQMDWQQYLMANLMYYQQHQHPQNQMFDMFMNQMKRNGKSKKRGRRSGKRDENRSYE